jgi:hypothetical protein
MFRQCSKNEGERGFRSRGDASPNTSCYEGRKWSRCERLSSRFIPTGCSKGKKQHMPGVFVYHGCTGARGRVFETLTHEKGSYNLLCLFLFSTIYSHLSKHLMKKFTATFLLL